MNCEWTDWQIGECSVSCGIGTRTEIRSKSVEEKNGGVCIGETTVQADCHDAVCPGKILYTLFLSNRDLYLYPHITMLNICKT